MSSRCPLYALTALGRSLPRSLSVATLAVAMRLLNDFASPSPGSRSCGLHVRGAARGSTYRRQLELSPINPIS
jgi:hypothetical protein